MIQALKDSTFVTRVAEAFSPFGSKKLTVNHRINLYEFLIALIEKGSDIQSAIGDVSAAMERQAQAHPIAAREMKATARLFREIEAELREGTPLHLCLSNRVPDSEVMMIMAGSEGSIVAGLREAALQARRSKEDKENLIKAIAYPILVSLGSLFAIDFLGSTILVEMSKLFPVVQWAPNQQTLFWLTNNVEVWATVVALALLALGTVLSFIAKVLSGPARERIHFIPPFNIIRKRTGASYLSTLASLVQAGRTIKGALIEMRNVTSSNYMRYYLEDAVNQMRIGVASQGPGRALASSLFTPEIMVKLDIHGRSSGDTFADTMHSIADEARQSATKSMKLMSMILNGLILLSTFSVVGYTVLTMYSIIEAVKSGL